MTSVFTWGQRRELQTIEKQKPEELYDTYQRLCLSSINDCSRKSDLHDVKLKLADFQCTNEISLTFQLILPDSNGI